MTESNAQDLENNTNKTAEASLFPQEKPESNPEQTVKSRKKLFQDLDVVLATAKEKFNKQKALNSDRQKWARIIISAVAVYGDLLRDFELENIGERITKLESQISKNHGDYA